MIIEIKKVEAHFKSADHVFDLKVENLKLNPGQVTSLIGRSGSGKTTLLRCLAGLQPCVLETQNFPRHVGMVFQSFNLFSHLTVLENILLPLQKVKKLSRQAAEKRAREVLDQVGLVLLEKKYAHEISGGQQQRAAIARALAMDPEIMLYDEPTSSLDPELTQEIGELIVKLKSQGLTQVLVSHEPRLVHGISDQVIYLDGGRMKACYQKKQNAFQPISGLNQEELHETHRSYLRLFDI